MVKGARVFIVLAPHLKDKQKFILDNISDSSLHSPVKLYHNNTNIIFLSSIVTIFCYRINKKLTK